jgi:hypothetical protein
VLDLGGGGGGGLWGGGGGGWGGGGPFVSAVRSGFDWSAAERRRRSGGNDRISLLGGGVNCRGPHLGAACCIVVRYGEI